MNVYASRLLGFVLFQNAFSFSNKCRKALGLLVLLLSKSLARLFHNTWLWHKRQLFAIANDNILEKATTNVSHIVQAFLSNTLFIADICVDVLFLAKPTNLAKQKASWETR